MFIFKLPTVQVTRAGTATAITSPAASRVERRSLGMIDRELFFMTFRELFPMLRMPVQDERDWRNHRVGGGLEDQETAVT